MQVHYLLPLIFPLTITTTILRSPRNSEYATPPLQDPRLADRLIASVTIIKATPSRRN
jgi:hypothetical protein